MATLTLGRQGGFSLGQGLTLGGGGAGDPAIISLSLASGISTDTTVGTLVGTLSYTLGPRRPSDILLDITSGISTDTSIGALVGTLRTIS